MEEIINKLNREGLKTASITKRAIAMTIDDLLVSLIIVFAFSSQFANAKSYEEILVLTNELFGYIFVAYTLYHCIFIAIYGKTIGKMIDNTLTLEGLFSIVLFGKVNKNDDGVLEYGFETQNNGENTCKSPMGMFEDMFIPNDLKYVKECIQKYEE